MSHSGRKPRKTSKSSKSRKKVRLPRLEIKEHVERAEKSLSSSTTTSSVSQNGLDQSLEPSKKESVPEFQGQPIAFFTTGGNVTFSDTPLSITFSPDYPDLEFSQPQEPSLSPQRIQNAPTQDLSSTWKLVIWLSIVMSSIACAVLIPLLRE